MTNLPPARLAGRRRFDRGAAPVAGASFRFVAAIVLGVAGCGGPAPNQPAAASTSIAPRSPARTAAEQSLQPPAGTSSTASAAAGLVIGATWSEGRVSFGLVGVDGRTAPLAPPGRGIRQLRSLRGGLLAVLDDGRLALASVDGTSARWRDVPGLTGLAAASASPDGAVLALVAADRLGRGAPLEVGLADTAGRRRTGVTAPRLEANGGPAWFDDGRIALRALAPGERDVLALLRPGARGADTLPLDGIDLISSGDGATVAVLGLRSIRVRATSEIAKSGTGAAVETPSQSSTDRGQLADGALDAAGHRIAYVWADESGTPQTIVICAAASGWREVARLEVPPGAARVLLAWTS